MAYDGTLKFDTKIDDSGFSSGLSKIGSLAEKGMKVVASASLAAAGGVAALGTSALKSYASYEQLVGGVETLFKNSSDKLVKYAEDAYKTAGMSTNQFLDTATSFASSLVQSLARTSTESTEINVDALETQQTALKESCDESESALRKSHEKQIDDFEKMVDANIKQIDRQYTENLKLIDEEKYQKIKAINDKIDAINAEQDAEDKAAESKKRQSKLDEYNEQIAKAQRQGNITKAAELEKQLADYKEQIRAEDAKKARQSQIDSLKDEKSAVQDEYDKKKEQLKENYQEQREIVKSSYDEQLKALKESQQAEQEALQKSNDKKIANFKEYVEQQKELAKSGSDYVLNYTEETYDEAAELANMAVIDMSDNANKMGTDMTDLQNAYQGFAKQNYTMLDNLKLGYGGTKSEMERLLSDAEKISGIHYDVSSFSDIVSAIHVVQTEMGITGTTALEASETISGSVGMMKASFSNLVAGIANDNADFDKLMSEFVESVTIAAGNILPRVEVILTGIGKFVEGMGGVLSQALLSVTDILPDLIQAGINLVETLVSTIAENADTVTESAIEIGLALIKGFADIIPQLAQIGFTVLTTLINGITEHISDITAIAVTFVKNLASVIVQNAPALIKAGAELIASLITAIAENSATIIESVIEVVLAVGQALIDNAPIIIEALIEALPLILQALVDALPMFITAVVQLNTQIAEMMPDLFDQLIGMLPDLIGQLVKALVDNAPLLLAAFSTMFLTALQALSEMFISLMSELYDLEAELGQWLSEKIDDIGDFFADIIDTIDDFIDETIDNIADWGENILDSVADTVSDFLDTVKQYFMQIPDKIKNGLDDAFTAIKNWGSDVVDKMVESGKNLVEGLWNGIKDKAEWIKDKIASFGDTIVDAFKDVFGIHSPSTVMRDSVGKYLAEGVGVGFTNAIPDIAKQAKEVLTSNLSAAEIGLDLIGADISIEDMPDVTGKIDLSDVSEDSLPLLPTLPEVTGNNETTLSDIANSIINNTKYSSGINNVSNFANNNAISSNSDYYSNSVLSTLANAISNSNSADNGYFNSVYGSNTNNNSTIYTPDALQALSSFSSRSERFDSSLSATSNISNSYINSTANNSNSVANTGNNKPIVINAEFVVGEEVVAEGVMNLIDGEIDERQGMRVNMKKRGVAT